MEKRMFTDAARALAFMLAGKATVTFRSKATGQRFTYRIRLAKDSDPRRPLFFVSYLFGPDNTTDYHYLGIITPDGFRTTKKSHAGDDQPVTRAFVWVFGNLRQVRLPENLEVWHEGKCGKCGRKLTVPESIERGIGPECAQVLGMAA